jgi:hypothetical protein
MCPLWKDNGYEFRLVSFMCLGFGPARSTPRKEFQNPEAEREEVVMHPPVIPTARAELLQFSVAGQ